ncbi:hypothetical protein V6N13_124111 [Hibiscus sabdariffa]|uniref:Uncharacterized protein n=1 Tax=Hibiscus sabdariffa TaxID=183260 RepID=A0ABR2S0F0_9ROSI
MSSSPSDIVGRWGKSLDDFSEDEENTVPVTKDDDVHLLDADDVEVVMIDASEGNGLDVEDDVWSVAVARLGLGNDKPNWGYVRPETEQPIPVIQLMNLQQACMTWTILQCEIGNMMLAYLVLHHPRTMGNWY